MVLAGSFALDSLTGDDVACAIFARRIRIASTESRWTSPRPSFLGSRISAEGVDLQTVQRDLTFAEPLVLDGSSRWAGGEREITAVTYAADDVAREFGIIDKLPCLVFLDALSDSATRRPNPADIGYDVVSLREYRPTDIVQLLRRVLHTLRSHSLFVSYSQTCVNLRVCAIQLSGRAGRSSRRRNTSMTCWAKKPAASTRDPRSQGGTRGSSRGVEEVLSSILVGDVLR